MTLDLAIYIYLKDTLLWSKNVDRFYRDVPKMKRDTKRIIKIWNILKSTMSWTDRQFWGRSINLSFKYVSRLFLYISYSAKSRVKLLNIGRQRYPGVKQQTRFQFSWSKTFQLDRKKWSSWKPIDLDLAKTCWVSEQMVWKVYANLGLAYSVFAQLDSEWKRRLSLWKNHIISANLPAPLPTSQQHALHSVHFLQDNMWHF